eukprot:TRINITY_DN4437_c0_g1_i4.p1 TRINITY_DN4437_c0_g1~~TRINITY_DN4437_c0_g1_i4.p1  ORF type:complete len:363 (-),score=55.15 TRINITY_DN4437_c0_g1_i4:261-1349(-)
MSCDWDALLAYNTVKVVEIREKKLGAIHFFFVFSILAYVVLYLTIYSKGYLIFESPIGNMRFQVSAPESYTDVSDLYYCEQNPNALPEYNPKLCVKLSPSDLVFPEDMTNSLFLTTAMDYKEYYRNCSEDTMCIKGVCSLCGEDWILESEHSVYVQDAENHIIEVSHSAAALEFDKSYVVPDTDRDECDPSKARSGGSGPPVVTFFRGNSLYMEGALTAKPGNGSPSVVKCGEVDRFTAKDFIENILNEESIILDQQSDITDTTGTFREDGIVVSVRVSYSNIYDFFSPSLLQYFYSTYHVKHTRFISLQRVSEDTFSADQKKIERVRRGIRLDFLQTGEIGSFDLYAMLLKFVSAIALFTG